MTLQLLHSEFPYIGGKFDFLFYQCRVSTLRCSLRHGYTVHSDYKQCTESNPVTAYSVRNFDPAFHHGDHLGAELCCVERVGGVVELLRLLRRG